MSEVAEIARCRLVVKSCRLYFSLFGKRETAKVETLPVADDFGFPHVSPMGSVTADAFESTFTVAVNAAISCVLCGCAYAKVRILIVQRIAVDMISHALVSCRESKNHAVHTRSQSNPRSVIGWNIYFRVERLLVWTPTSVPSKLVQLFKSMRAYFSNFALGERDFAIFFFWGLHSALLESVGWIGRLRRPDPSILTLEAVR